MHIFLHFNLHRMPVFLAYLSHCERPLCILRALCNTSIFPDWVRKYKTKGVAIPVSGQNYYVYEMSNRWGKEKKRADKITGQYLGVVTHEGIVKSRSMELVGSDYECGNIALLHGIA